MRIAVVVTEETPGRIDAARARLEQARSRGEAVLVAPPQVAAMLGETGHWAEAAVCDRATVGVRPGPAPLAFEALRSLGALLGPIDEARFEAASAAGQVACAEARTGGDRVAARLVVELDPGDGALVREVALGDRIEDRLHLCAARMALRDADAVEGDEAARAALLGAGWTLAAQQPEPAWNAAEAPAVSAVITFYNLGRYLPACLASLRAQTVPCEVIVVDDGSSPEEAAVLDAEAARDPGLRVIRQANQGVVAARNAGIKAAGHPLVLIVDADNLLRPRMVERLREALRLRPDAAWANPAFRSFRDGTDETAFVYGSAEFPGELLLLRNVVGDVCALHRRAALEQVGGFSVEGSAMLEDWALWLRETSAGLAGVALPEELFDYRERAGSMLRGADLLARNLARLQLLRLGAGLLARHSTAALLLAASELTAEAEHNQWLGRREAARELDQLRVYANRLETELTGARGHGERVDAELAGLRDRSHGVEDELRIARAYLLRVEDDLRTAREYLPKVEAELQAVREVELPVARSHAARMERELIELRVRAEGLDRELIAVRGHLLHAEVTLPALQQRSLALEHEVESFRARSDELGAELAAAREVRAKEAALRSGLEESKLEALQRASAAELALAEIQVTLDELMGSRAVQLAQAVRDASPLAHRAAAQVAGVLLDRIKGR